MKDWLYLQDSYKMMLKNGSEFQRVNIHEALSSFVSEQQNKIINIRSENTWKKSSIFSSWRTGYSYDKIMVKIGSEFQRINIHEQN